MLKKSILIVFAFALGIALIIFGLIGYSYTQITVSFSDISSVNVELETLSLSSLVKLGLDVLSGNWLAAALDVLAGINLGLVFELTNNGLLPVYIPELSYNLSINDVFIGDGSSIIDTTIDPGEKKEIQIMQNFQKNSFSPAIESIIDAEGIIDVKINGVAYFELLGFNIPVEFESTKQISIVEEIQNQLNQQPLN
jgi:LEA14-like dessication related protein